MEPCCPPMHQWLYVTLVRTQIGMCIIIILLVYDKSSFGHTRCTLRLCSMTFARGIAQLAGRMNWRESPEFESYSRLTFSLFYFFICCFLLQKCNLGYILKEFILS